jgi:hypothetical protein
VTDDWYARLQASGLLDTLAPYAPVLVGAYPLGMAAPGSRIEIVCRATDLPAFARTLERTYGGDGFAMYPGTLSLEDAVFAEFDLDGLPLEVAAQSDHEHRKLGAATIGISRVLEMEGDVSRDRLAARGGRRGLAGGRHAPDRPHPLSAGGAGHRKRGRRPPGAGRAHPGRRSAST